MISGQSRYAVRVTPGGGAPLLRAAAHRAARDALAALSRRFLAVRPASIAHGSLARGHAGLAIVHAALDVAFPGTGHARRATRSLERALGAVASRTMGPSLWSGIAGVAWATELLRGDPRVPPEDDVLAPIDEALEGHLASSSPWDEPYDLMDGLVGLGVYALERVPRASGVRLVELVVRRLAETARSRSPGVAWRSDPAWVPPPFRGTPHPAWNLGVAHGVPGVVALLARVVAAEVPAATRRKARALLDGAAAWLLAQELPRDAEGAFARAAGRGVPREPARLAWCYGDAGVAAALLVAARAAGEPAWTRAARRIGRRAAARSVTGSGVVDAGLCHGAAGVAHAFHRIALATRDAGLAAASRAWFARALAMRRGRGGFAGFSAYLSDAAGAPGWSADPGFLTGAGGVALALLAATAPATAIAVPWDRALLLA
jgi:hypothetical protein